MNIQIWNQIMKENVYFLIQKYDLPKNFLLTMPSLFISPYTNKQWLIFQLYVWQLTG
jgi:hypothetical protein